MFKTLKALNQKLTNRPSEEEMRKTLVLFRTPTRIKTPEDALLAGGFAPILPQPAAVRLDN